MQKKKPLNQFLARVLIFLIIMTVFFQVIQPHKTYQSMNSNFYSFSSYLKYFFTTSPVEAIKNLGKDYTGLVSVQQENKVLRESVSEVEKLKSQLMEVQQDNQSLKNQLQLSSTLSEYTVINATTINQESQELNHYLVIDKGSDDGIELNMAVLNAQGLIGQISEVTSSTAMVKLLTSQDGQNQFSVKIQIEEGKTVEALLESYDSEKKEYLVRLLDTVEKVKPQDKVITSGLGHIIPSGLYIGEVKSVEESVSTLSIVLKVIPASQFTDLKYVSVVKK